MTKWWRVRLGFYCGVPTRFLPTYFEDLTRWHSFKIYNNWNYIYVVNRNKTSAEVIVHAGGGGKCCVDKIYYCNYLDSMWKRGRILFVSIIFVHVIARCICVLRTLYKICVGPPTYLSKCNIWTTIYIIKYSSFFVALLGILQQAVQRNSSVWSAYCTVCVWW